LAGHGILIFPDCRTDKVSDEAPEITAPRQLLLFSLLFLNGGLMRFPTSFRRPRHINAAALEPAGRINKFSLDSMLILASRGGLKTKIDVRSAA
jgi:hypothetical protein